MTGLSVIFGGKYFHAGGVRAPPVLLVSMQVWEKFCHVPVFYLCGG
jgi:hypothetical protein